MNRTVVATLRGVALAAAVFVTTVLVGAAGVDLPPALDEFKIWIPILLVVSRAAEGAFDQVNKGDDPHGVTGVST